MREKGDRRPRLGFPRHPVILAAALVGLCLIAYQPGRMENTTGDTVTARYWPISILKFETWTMNPFRTEFGAFSNADVKNQKGDVYPWGGLASLPFTVPVFFAADVTGWGFRPGERSLTWKGIDSGWSHDRVYRISKWNGVILATASVLALFAVLCRIVSPRAAAAASVIFALGTWNWSLSAQGLHPQGMVVLTHQIALGLLLPLCVSSKIAWRRSLLAAALGPIHVLIWALRPIDAVLIAPAVLLLARDRRLLIPYAAAAAAAFVPTLFAQLAAYDHLLGFYAWITVKDPPEFSGPLDFVAALGSLLFSPNRGALVFFPFLILAPWLSRMAGPWKANLRAFVRSRKAPPTRAGQPPAGLPASFAGYLVVAVPLYVIMLATLPSWHATWSYGSRYLFDLGPFLFPFVALAIERAMSVASRGRRGGARGADAGPRWLAAALAFASLQAVFIHGMGHRNYDVWVWNFEMQPITTSKTWHLANPMLVEVWRRGSNDGRWSDAYQRLLNYGF